MNDTDKEGLDFSAFAEELSEAMAPLMEAIGLESPLLRHLPFAKFVGDRLSFTMMALDDAAEHLATCEGCEHNGPFMEVPDLHEFMWKLVQGHSTVACLYITQKKSPIPIPDSEEAIDAVLKRLIIELDNGFRSNGWEHFCQMIGHPPGQGFLPDGPDDEEDEPKTEEPEEGFDVHGS